MNIHGNLDAASGLPRESTAARPAGSAAGGSLSGLRAGLATGGAPVADEDTASISAAGLSAAAASEVSDVRTEKVAQIQQALASGTYAVSPLEVAGKLIDTMLQSR